MRTANLETKQTNKYLKVNLSIRDKKNWKEFKKIVTEEGMMISSAVEKLVREFVKNRKGE